MLTWTNSRILVAALLSLLIHLAVMEVGTQWQPVGKMEQPGRKTVRLSLLARHLPPQEKPLPTPAQPQVAPEPSPIPAPVPQRVPQRVREAAKPRPLKPPSMAAKKVVSSPPEGQGPRPVVLEQPVAEVVAGNVEPVVRPLGKESTRVPDQNVFESATLPVIAAPEPPPVLVEAEPLYRSNPPPEYPSSARRRHLQGTVILDLLISADGLVETVDLHESSGHPLLDETARRAVAPWQFAPGTRNGVPIQMHVLVPVRFQLR